MEAILVRIGVDYAYGKWNAPADPDTREFVYVSIPEKQTTTFHVDCERRYDTILPVLEEFADRIGQDVYRDLKFPAKLLKYSMHLDPDFDTLTYGDMGSRRGSHLRAMSEGDLVVFYAGLRPTKPTEHNLIYAIVGLFVIDGIVDVADVPEARWHENAHTRKVERGESDIVVRAKPGLSGRLNKFLAIGEFRDGAYRVRKDLLDTWGQLTVKNGFIQRSARPPRFNNPERFYEWFSPDIARKIE